MEIQYKYFSEFFRLISCVVMFQFYEHFYHYFDPKKFKFCIHYVYNTFVDYQGISFCEVDNIVNIT